MRSLVRPFKSDESLMHDYGRGDAEAFDVLYQRHKDKLFNFVYRSCQHRDAVEDIAHDTWVAVIRAAERYQKDAKFTTWLYQIARNKLIDHWRKRKPDHFSTRDPDEITQESLVRGRQDQDIGELDLVNSLIAELTRLPLEQREAFLLKEEGFSQKEIAEITGVKQETVKSRVRYARERLRTQMGAVA